jgi:hypothetical protein
VITDQICDFPYGRIKGNLLVLLDEGDGVATGPADEAFEDLLFFGDIERGVLVVMKRAKRNVRPPFLDDVNVRGNDRHDVGVFKMSSIRS